jgi:LmbE family N-acetylglucosaminyl deacetylase
MRTRLVVVLIAVAVLSGVTRNIDLGTGHAGLGLALRRLITTGTLMMATAHPDDENNGLLAWASRGLGVRTTLATATRGDGGQNEIGPELFDALAALRTEELLAAHRFDGAEQFFTRAVDFGYSFSIEETFEKWGKDEIVGDYVRLIRAIRPDVIVGLRPDGAGGGQHHQASARLAREAFRAAGDPSRFPEQIRDGLRPWQPKKFYFTGSFGFRGEPPPDPGKKFVAISLDTYDPLLGRTYAEIGSEARAMHKCQGFGQLLALPGPATARYELVETTVFRQQGVAESSLFDGIDLALPAIAGFAGSSAPTGLTSGLQAIADRAHAAMAAFERGADAQTIAPLAAGLTSTRALRGRLASLGLSEDARDEIDFRLAQKERQFEEALVLAHGLRIELLAGDGLVVPSQELKLAAIVANRLPREIAVRSIAFQGFSSAGQCPPGESKAGVIYTCSVSAITPVNVESSELTNDVYWRQIPGAARYEFAADVPFGAPFRPTPFRASLALTLGGVEVKLDRPVEYRYEGGIFSGEKRMELKLVPGFAIRVNPEIAIVTPAARQREIRVSVTWAGAGPTAAEVVLDIPGGWRAEPRAARVSLAREDEARTVKFTVTAPSDVEPGEYKVAAAMRSAHAPPAGIGYQIVEYPHIERRHLRQPAQAEVKSLDVRMVPNLRVGYVMGVGDEVPPAIEQLGATVTLLGPDDLAWGDLSKYDVVVTGVRAYERRADLRAHNERLLEYARRGGVVIVQYNKFEFNEAQYGPYPAKVSSNRITDEHAPVKILVPDHLVFQKPNAIDVKTWEGWVQERGLYFLGDRDPRYVDLIEMTDPFPNNAGPKRGALVEATLGEGRWIYVGLGLWRQLPAGTPGAYALLANLLSLAR